MTNIPMTALDVADALRGAAAKAADLLEHLDHANDQMRSASLGVLPDGTPVEDMLEELKEAKARIADLHVSLRAIKHEAGKCSSATAYAAIKSIREMTATASRA